MVQNENLASMEAGAFIKCSTCESDEFPTLNIIDGKMNTFWPTTGMYPQEFVLEIKPNKLKKIIISCRKGIIN
jgi:hypothetical protein